jgi:hypothetical protein
MHATDGTITEDDPMDIYFPRFNPCYDFLLELVFRVLDEGHVMRWVTP